MGAGPTEADWRELDTTPEFREFVGKKLDQLVSGMIKEKDRCKHLRSAPVEEGAGGVQLFAGAPPLEVTDATPEEPPPPAKRPKLTGVDLQRYQLKKKSRRERDRTGADGTGRDRQPVGKTESTPAADTSAGDAKTAAPAENGRAGKEGSDASSDSDSDDDDLARFAEAAVPADFMTSLAKSKTVKLDAT